MGVRKVNLIDDYPSFKYTHQVNFPKLMGGMNTQMPSSMLETHESPLCLNVWWNKGSLQCRPAQVDVAFESDYIPAKNCYEELFHGYAVVKNFMTVSMIRIDDDQVTPDQNPSVAERFEWLVGADAEESGRGSFVLFDDKLYYKNESAFIRIEYDPDGSYPDMYGRSTPFKVEEIGQSNAYIPYVLMNCNTETAAGDTFESENRFCAYKKITYNIVQDTTKVILPNIAGLRVGPEGGEDRWPRTRVLFNGSPVAYTFEKGNALRAPSLTFSTALKATDPVINNTLEVIYYAENTDAYFSISDCKYMAKFGRHILMYGLDTQPNAVFWNTVSAGTTVIDPTYFPIDCYQFVGDASDVVTGMHSMYNDLIVLKENSVWKLNYTQDTVDGLVKPLFLAELVNENTGCDMPGSIQLVNNNIVFANSKTGIHMVQSMTSAYENNIIGISDKINAAPDRVESYFYKGSAPADEEGKLRKIFDFDDGSLSQFVDPTGRQSALPGLIGDLRRWKEDSTGETYRLLEGYVASVDHDGRYWLAVGNHVYVWDYSISTYANPSWFVFTGTEAIGFIISPKEHLFSITRRASVRRFVWPQISDMEVATTGYKDQIFVYRDGTYVLDEVAVPQFYAFPMQNFGTYDKLKDVRYVLFSFKPRCIPDGPQPRLPGYDVVELAYYSDYGVQRSDRTNLKIPTEPEHNAVLLPPAVHKRVPGQRHVRHFGMALACTTGGSLSPLTAQIFYTTTGKER